MSNPIGYLDYAGAQYIVNQLQAKINKKASQADLDNFKIPIASTSRLGGVMVGDGLNVNENGVLTATAQEVAKSWDDVLNKPNTLAGYGITDAVSMDALEQRIATMGKLYRYKGTVADLDALNAIVDPEIGDTYDVGDGANYAWNGEKWDALGVASIDMAGYMKDEDIRPLSIAELDAIMGIVSSTESLNMTLTQPKSTVSFELATDLNIEGQTVIGEGKNVTIDLNGKTINGNVSSADASVFIVKGGTLTLKNGTVESNGRIAAATNGGKIIIDGGNYTSADVALTATGTGAKVVFNDGTLNAVEGGLMAFDGAGVEFNGGMLNISDNFGLGTNGTAGRGGNTIVMNGGTINAKIKSAGYEAIGVYIPNDDTFIMNGGEILATDGAGLVMRGGHVIINDGKIVATGVAGTTGWVGDNKTKMSKSAIIYHERAKYPAKDSLNLEINGGVFIGVDNSIEVLSDEISPKVAINGGSYSPEYPKS